MLAMANNLAMAKHLTGKWLTKLLLLEILLVNGEDDDVPQRKYCKKYYINN